MLLAEDVGDGSAESMLLELFYVSQDKWLASS